MPVADVIVVGLGAMGSAAAYQAARSGLSVIGIDRFHPPHAEGSSHGETRITRQAIGEGEHYVPLVLRSQDLWREIEAETGEELFLACGALVLSPENNAAVHHGKTNFLEGTVSSARRYGVAHEVLSADDIAARFPQFDVAPGTSAYLEQGGGLLYPERCVGAQLDLARRHGAAIYPGEAVTSVETAGGGVRITTDRGVYEGSHAIVAAGAWMPGLIGEPLGMLEVHRQTLFWFETTDTAYDPERCPVYIWMHGEGAQDYFYGFPRLPGAGTVKVATERYGSPLLAPEQAGDEVNPSDAAAMHAAHVAGRLRNVSSRSPRSATCFYTTTPDGDFIIDHHPDSDRILVVSACSGHGFKHSAAIGECLAERVVSGRSRIDLGGFGVGRFGSGSSATAAVAAI